MGGHNTPVMAEKGAKRHKQSLQDMGQTGIALPRQQCSLSSHVLLN